MENNFISKTPKFAFKKIGAEKNNLNFNENFIQLCAPDEIFVWVTHCDLIPNVFEHRYLISNYGRVFDCYRNCFNRMKFNSSGYLYVYLYYFTDPFNYTFRMIFVHRLVAFYFLYFPNCQLLQVNHKDGNKTNNIWKNLEWVNQSQNMKHAFENGLAKRCEDHTNAKYTNQEVEKICELLCEGLSNIEIEKLTGMPARQVSEIRTGKVYASISNKYPKIKESIKHMSKFLTDDQVHQVCSLIVQGFSCNKVAKIVGCTESQVKSIRFCNAYSHISKFYNLDAVVPKAANRIDDEIARNICKELEEQKLNCHQIAEKFNVGNQTVISIKNGLIYKDISKDFKLPGRNKKPRINEKTAELICVELAKKDGRTNEQIAKDLNVNVNAVLNLRKKLTFPKIVTNFDF